MHTVKIQATGLVTFGAPVVNERPGIRLRVKRSLDFALAASLIVALTPLLLLCVALVTLTSPGPALYRQQRVGIHGRRFTMLKFRSMVVDADDRIESLRQAGHARNEVLFKLRDDPRVTPFGRLLRRLSLDELPQLFNVLTGSMSLVGPRPPLPSEVTKYDSRMHRRLSVQPGMTGLWQVSGRSTLSWEQSIRLDLQYVDTWSLRLDARILLKTLRVVVTGHGAY